MRRARRFVLIASGGAILFAIIPVLVAVVARFSDGPISVFPGGPLISGIPTEYGGVDWSRVAQIREIELQLETPARSRTTRFFIHDGTPYVPCAFCNNRLLKRWPRELEYDDRVVLRVGGMLIEGRARRVPNESAEYAAARHAHALKYSDRSNARSAAEGRAASLVVLAARLVPGAPDASEPDSWLYRIDPR
jgi:hypothetical protein